MLKGLTKEEKSWIMYDWANSAYTMVVISTIMSLYFLDEAKMALTGLVKDPEVTANAYWGFANSISTLILVVLSPILGTLADYKGRKKQLFSMTLMMGIVSTVLLGLVPSGRWQILLVIFVFSTLAYSATLIFYDAFLVDVSEDANMDNVSSKGYALGYIGSTIPFILAMAIVVLATMGKLPISVTWSYRISFFITAVWWLVFSLPILKNVHQRFGIEPGAHDIRNSFVSIWKTFKEIKKNKAIFMFLLAYFFYIDGVDTIIKMATSYGKTIGIDSITLLLILLVTQFVAFPFALFYGRLAKTWGTKKTLFLGILTYCVICVVAFFMSEDRSVGTLTAMFWVLAMLVGTAQGGIQALSRSYFAKLVPKDHANQFFGFYNIFGKFAAIMGPVLFGWISLVTGKANYGVASIIVLFIVGALIFSRVPEVER